MHKYEYQACDIEGNIQYGQLTAENEQAVVLSLQSQQLIPLKIEEQAEEEGNVLSFGGSKISNRDLIDFTDGLTTLVEARIPIDRALILLEGITAKPALQQLIVDLRTNVKEGKSLADALQNHPQTFSRMYINMVHAGEEGGILEKLLPKLANFLASADEAKRTVISSMIYPMILLAVGVLSVGMLMVFVVPQFAQMFEDMGTSMPSSAAFLLNTSEWLKAYGWTLLFLPVIVWLGWRHLDSSSELRFQRDKFLLSLPLFGNLLLDAESSRFCRTLGSLLSAGIPLLKALHIARGVMENEVVNKSLGQVEEAVRSGASLGKSLINTGTFPTLLAQLVVVGEESGRTADILEKLAETFDTNVKQQTSRLVALAEPLLILILGVVVGAIVIIMLSAIFSITDVQL
ncbi:type II secretion system F family protein [Candidatus Albibeggiatoa sp. nov. BB20]|uniref:type II secretion system F family protein n=1 Tax=Candidatus Albibeggiatoa sp. nov. BB20 TaxID=3162723 RepID=UPI0033659A77